MAFETSKQAMIFPLLRWIVVSCFFIFFSNTSLKAQPKFLQLQSYTTEQGLSDNQVTCAISDHHGFMWIGTKDGLNRFDGRQYYIFKTIDNDTNAISGNSISSIAVDNDSIIWIGTTTSGLSSYNHRTGLFKRYNKQNSELTSESINSLKFDKHKNVIWIALNNQGLCMMDLNNGELKEVENNRTFYSVCARDTIAYFGALGMSLRKYNEFDKNFKSSSYYANTINTIHAGSDGYLWCGAWDNAIHQFDLSPELIKSYYFDGSKKLDSSGDEILTIAEDDHQVLWLGTKLSGIRFLNLQNKSFHNDLKYSPSITSRINDIFKDSYNRMWICTNAGLYLYDPLLNQFEITHLPVKGESESCQVNGRIFTNERTEVIITACGLFYKLKNETTFRFASNIYENKELRLTSIIKSGNGTIIIGSNKTLFELRTHDMKLQPLTKIKKGTVFDFKSIFASNFNSLNAFRYRDDTLIMASVYGHFLMLIDPNSLHVAILLPDKSKKHTNPENLVRKIYTDSKNRIWLCGVSKGVQQVVLDEPNKFNEYFTEEGNIYFDGKWTQWSDSKQQPGVSNVYDMIENRHGSFWMTTQGSGLVLFQPENKNKLFTQFNTGINSLQGLALSENQLWIITSSGLLHYDTDLNRHKLYGWSTGLPQGLTGYFHEGEKGKLVAGFDRGYIEFHPDSIKPDQEKPNVHLTQMWIMDEPSDNFIRNKLNTAYNRNFLRFYISSNCFSNNDQVTYQYQLEGIDEKWRNNQHNPLITYTNLPPGEYRLTYKAINSNGLESSIGTYLIEIIPPFYKTWYFYTILVILIISSAWWFYKFRIRQLMNLHEVRNKIARDLHDDIGSTLGSIHWYSQIANIKIKSNQLNDISTIMEKIESGSQEIIDKTSDTVWAVKPENDRLEDLLYRMEAYAAALLGVANISFDIACEENLKQVRLRMETRKNLFLIFKEAIHNILKYSNCTEIFIKFSGTRKSFKMFITDNGIGFDADRVMPYNGNGVANMKKRAEEIGGVFSITSAPGSGTSIEVALKHNI